VLIRMASVSRLKLIVAYTHLVSIYGEAPCGGFKRITSGNY